MFPKDMRTGITTGTCAAAAAKAAVLAWTGQKPSIVEVVSPQGQLLYVPIASSEATPVGGRASVIKDAGDDPDHYEWSDSHCGSRNTGLPGYCDPGRYWCGKNHETGTLKLGVGEAAINFGPRRMITRAVRDVLSASRGAIVTVTVPEGEKLAKRTLNPILGIVGGEYPILGNYGYLLSPMSEEAFKNSLTPQISVIKALGYTDIVFVPGKIGQNFAVNSYGLPAENGGPDQQFYGAYAGKRG